MQRHCTYIAPRTKPYAAAAATPCDTDKAGVQPRPHHKPERTDFDLQLYVAIACRSMVSIPLLHVITWITILIYRPQRDGRLRWPRWLTHSGQFTHEVATYQPLDRAQVRESPPAKDRRTNVRRCQHCHVGYTRFLTSMLGKLNYNVNYFN